MLSYNRYFLRRLAQFALVVFVGINVTYFITHFTPIDPVEATIGSLSQFSTVSPEAIEMMRESLRELYGVDGTPIEQYFAFWGRILTGDFGPSLSAFPTPVSVLMARAIPWTVGLLLFAVLVSWALGNLLGGLAGYYRESRTLRFIGVITMGLHPIPYYIVAFVLLIIFGLLWPVLPISGGFQMNMRVAFDLDFILSVIKHAFLPALSLVLVGVGGWFMGMRSLVSNVVTEDYVVYAELGGVDRRRILQSYVMRNALAPQLTGLAMQLGAIFNGAIITEEVFNYPGIGHLLIEAVQAGDYSLVVGITSMSIIGVSVAVFLIDMIYPLLDPRVQLA
jgi:peptide/nickel transport system permease protein